MAEQVSGKTFGLAKNDLGLQNATLAFKPDGFTLEFQEAQSRHVLPGAFGTWRRGETALPSTPPRLVSGGAPKPGTPSRVAVAGAWKYDQTFDLLVRYYETPHHDTITCRFEGGKIKIGFLSSIAALRGATDKRTGLEGEQL
jgi:hypothetical protein